MLKNLKILDGIKMKKVIDILEQFLNRDSNLHLILELKKMTHTELKQAILGYIREIYKAEYNGRLKIEDLEPEGYKVAFNLNNTENPIVFMADLPDEEYLKFIKE
jgi:hypothetical protein